ncbi:hypothetical protein F6455_06900 [Proteobacteria bacterium 005FR1]|nr:hypothetical protein [Proteobacteria bacterium 005FR1]
MTTILAKQLTAAAIVASSAFISATVNAGDSFSDTYSNGKGGRGAAITGVEPSATGTYPVFVYMVGTWEDHENASAMAAINSMADRGYVAATVDYSNSTFGDCSTLSQRSKYIFDAKNNKSAISKLCSRSKADCSRGVVVGGFSQGSILAVLGNNFDARIEAAYALGAGVQYDSYDLRACVADGNRTLPSDRLRAINGEGDAYMGGTAASVQAQLEELTGLAGGSGHYSAFRTNNSGWYMVSHSEVSDGQAEHCYMRNGGCGFNENRLDSLWTNGGSEWSLEPNLDWISSFTR